MRRRTLLASTLILVVQLLLSAAAAPAEPVSAQTPPKNGSAQQFDKQAQSREFKARLKVSQAEREAAADRARARGLKIPAATGGRLGAAMVPGGTQAPHYFGPFPNYANSPLATTTTTSTGAVVGNPLTARTYATESGTPPGVAGPVFAVIPTPALPAGMLQDFRIFNQASPGGSPTPSAGKQFHAYLLRPTGVANQYTVVYDSGSLVVPALPAGNTTGQVETFPVAGSVPVLAGDVIGFYGEGIPVDVGIGSDPASYPVSTAPGTGSTVTLGGAGFPLLAKPRTHSFAASVGNSTTTVTGGIRKFVDSLPGLSPAGANLLGQYIPVAVADTTTYPATDYYEIAVVQYREKMHSDLPATLLRGYVQLETSTNAGVSAHVALTNAMLDGTTTPILAADGSPVLAVDRPHYLGPVISATKDRPVRILFRNLLPTGVAGSLFLPVDTTVMGSGPGPEMMMMAEPDPQNPMCGQVPKPASCFTENRATLHLHGGISPWISDGTPHQWITPAKETTPYPRGVSVSNVPDMPDPGPGAQTFFYTNQQSARLMFYHDHAWGITRLNVYAGEAAGYLITDDVEKSLIAQGIIPDAAATIPLVIQDKTFVPSAAQLAVEDPTWDAGRWGGEGNLWVPHVYMTAQNPGDSSGVNQFGRWAYGPWFWPPTVVGKDIAVGPKANPYFDPNCDPSITWCEPPEIPGTPYLSMGMEAFNDTPVVNGTAYPKVTVDPKSYRLRLLSAANDRFWNLQFYQAVDAHGALCGGTGNPAPEASGIACTEVRLNPAEVQAALTDPTIFPTPDPTTAGPSWIQIGTEGGFLPVPVAIPNQPTTWVADPTVFNAGNVDQHSLLLGPAERADVIVDFSAFAGKTLILYNDAPAAFPARDPRYDYYTGNPDLTDTGGAPSTPAGFGPNTRTLMQIRVAATLPGGAPPAAAFDQTQLNAAFAHHLDANQRPAGVFESSQNPIIVGQGAYNSAYGSSFRTNGPMDGFARISDQSLTFNTLLNGAGGPTLTVPLQPKAIHDEMGGSFDHDYGRMSGNLGLEAPGATPLTQNVILYPYVNPATEILSAVVDASPIATAADGTQIWKITHNGVDTHPIHWHLFDVQLLNRVGWDGILRRPDENELGWKDTLRVSPLEDTIVAVRPILPKMPFGLPDSVRPLNPMMPLGSTAMFNNTDTNGNPIPPIVNQVTNFGWEYVWHCHILSHEEMDMMRPIIFHVDRQLPAAPTLTSRRSGASVVLTWTDATQPSNPGTLGNPANEVGFEIQRATVGKAGKPTYSRVGTALANATTFTDSTADTTSTYSYRVVAFNAAGGSPSNGVTEQPTTTLPSAPTNLVATSQAGPQVSLTWNDNAPNETGFAVERALGTGAFTRLATVAPSANTGSVSYTDSAVAAGSSYTYRVSALYGGWSSAFSNMATVAIPAPPPPQAPSVLVAVAATDTGTADTATLKWADNANNETGFTLDRATNSTFTAGLVTISLPANATTTQQTGLARNTTYWFRIRADNAGGSSAWSKAAGVRTP